MLHRQRLVVAAAAVVITASVLAGGHSAGAAGPQVLGYWTMDEAAGATTLVDSSGNGYHGTIGNKVLVAQRIAGATAHNFPYISSTAPPDPGRLDIVDQRSALNPGTGDFAVEVRVNTYSTHSNIFQKGQSGASGGFWKVEISDGLAACVFRGSSGSVGLKSKTRVTDKTWHVIRCERYATEAIMILDGVRVARTPVRTGNIANSWTLSIGGKSNCDSIKVECDYLRGSIDYVKIERPGTATATTLAPATTTTAAPSTTLAPATTTTAPPETTTVPPATTTTAPPATTTTTTAVPAGG